MGGIKDLRELSNLDSPEVLRGAIREFRRRLVVRLGWVLITLVAATFLVIYSIDAVRPPLSRIDSGGSVADPQVLQVSQANVVLYRAARFGDDVGVHFIIVDPLASGAACLDAIPPDGSTLVVDEDGSCGGNLGEHRYVLHRPPSGRIRFAVVSGQQEVGTFVLLMPTSGAIQLEDSHGA